MRLNKYIAHAGIASRRKADVLIQEGRVKVNGKVVIEMGFEINEKKDKVQVDESSIRKENRKVYILLNKPTGYISSVKDQFERKTVLDLVKKIKERVYPVGRLDYDSRGLLLLTNDGDLTYSLTHPKHEVKKTYIVLTRNRPKEIELDRLRRGLTIDDYKTSKAELRYLKSDERGTWTEIKIHEGKNRQIRKMFEAIGYKVIDLQRISIGNIKLKDLQEGKFRYLNEKEISYLKTLK